MTSESSRMGHSLTTPGALSSPALRFAATSPRPCRAPRAPRRSNVDPLDLVERDLLVQPVVELGGAGGLVPRNARRDFEVPAISKVLGDLGASEAVRADLGNDIPPDAAGKAIPYDIYDMGSSSVPVGRSNLGSQRLQTGNPPYDETDHGRPPRRFFCQSSPGVKLSSSHSRYASGSRRRTVVLPL